MERLKKKVKAGHVQQQPPAPQDDLTSSSSEDEGMHGDSTSDDQEEDDEQSMNEKQKDDTEAQLEKLVFGDHTGFRDDLAHFEDSDISEQEQVEDEDLDGEHGDDDLAAIQDSDLFFLDAGPDQDKTLLKQPLEQDSDLLAPSGRGPPAWVDSDDERMTVSLMSVPRLRKLRTFEGEDVISGKEYTNRLRQQYRSLHPTPEWAKWDPLKKSTKKRRRIGEDEEDLSDDDAMSTDDDEGLSTKPLAELLRSTAALTQTTASQSSSKRLKLNPEVIPITRMKDIGPVQPHSIDCLSVHPTLPLILSAGNSSTMYLHHLQPNPIPPEPANPLITSLHLKNTPLTTATFSPPTEDNKQTQPKIYLSSRRRYFHTWTLPTGTITKTTRTTGADPRNTTQRSFETLKPSPCGTWLAVRGTARKGGGGVVNILSATTHMWAAQARVDAGKGLADFVWWRDGRGLSILSQDGEVTEWSVAARRAVWRWRDDGGVGATTLALGGLIPDNVLLAGSKRDKARKQVLADGPPVGPDRWVAVGSQSGVVNIYDRAEFLEDALTALLFLTSSPSSNPPDHPEEDRDENARFKIGAPSPLRAIQNLTTPISHLQFSRDGQLLCAASRWKRDALRLVHLPSGAVYANWPTARTPFGRVSAVAFAEVVLPASSVSSSGGDLENDDAEVKRIVLLVGNESGALRGWVIG